MNRLWVTVASLLLPLLSAAGEARRAAPAFSTPQERCIVPASGYHKVNPHVLRAVLRVESGLRPTAINKNANGTIDVGMGQMNSMHFPALAQQGIAPGHLLDECIASYVAAWHLGKIMREHGNNWQAIARYHSATPYFNYRYQVLLSNELVRTGVIQGRIQPVPPLAPRASSEPRLAPSKRNGPSGGSLAFDASPLATP